ncbi:MAG TPA: Hsp20/alpha crystallin family protein [Candidatus Omnitrophica bacterium]|nr:Hsp20/alpha crystallin family protein [Candidatus Omnitrophota bacterium]
MALIPWRSKEMWINPFQDLERIQREMNRLFDSSLMGWQGRGSGLFEDAWSPAVDVYDSKDNIMVKADIPGMNKEDLDVSVYGDTLVIKGEKKQEKESRDKDFVRTERFYGAFQRIISLPAEVDAEKVSAVYKDGVLELVLAKKEESKPKQFKVDVK